MEYVMVPVPEELVEQVKSFMTWNLNAPRVAENPDAVRQVMEEADDDLRKLIVYIAQATVNERLPTLTETAEAVDMAPREVVGSIGDLLARTSEAGRRLPLIIPRPDPSERPDGVTPYIHRCFHMSTVDAELVLEL